MATNCEDVSARMVELLYGELPADARSGVDAHVAGCARCRSELEGLEKTRAVTRRALDESPPPRARAEILRRAAEHLAAQQPAAAAAAAAIVPAGKAKQAAEPEQARFWDWLRSRWTLPSLATVGAVALLVIGSRVLLEPDEGRLQGEPRVPARGATGRRARRRVRAEPAPAAAPAPAAGNRSAPTRTVGGEGGAGRRARACRRTIAEKSAAAPRPARGDRGRRRQAKPSARRPRRRRRRRRGPGAR